MNLSKLIHEVWKDKRVKDLGIRKSEVKVLVKVTVDHMLKGLLQFRKLKIFGLFTLEVRKASGRKIRHPQTGEEMRSQDYHKIGIKPSKRLDEGLKKLK